MVKYKDFAFKCKEAINELYSMKSLCDKATLLASGSFKPPADLAVLELSSLELFKVSSIFFIYLFSYLRSLTEIKMAS